MVTRQNILEMFHAALDAVRPEAMVRRAVTIRGETLVIEGRHFELPPGRPIPVFGCGKAALAAAKALADVLSDRFGGGFVITNDFDGTPTPVDVHIGAHPLADERSLGGALEMRRRLSALTEEDLFLFILTGGASALMEEPQPPLTLADLRETTQRLMFAGASIDRLNAVRKHLSLTKGGRLAQSTPARGIVLVISDVVGDDLGVVGSAPFYGDATTSGQVRRILEDADVWGDLPPSVREVLQRGLRGEIPETPREAGTRMEHVLIGNNRTALLAAGEKSRSLGIPTHLMTASLRGEAREAAQFIASLAEEIAATGNPFPPPVCLLFGGETTVTVKGDGQGGRNQELCLAFLKEAGPRFNGCFLSAGTDGIDGNSPAAGAVIHGDSWNTVKRLGLDMEDYLNRNDAFGLWNRTGDAIVIGPTGTNVMDIAILIVGGQSQWQQTYDFQRP